jgi:hypothetical protein
MYFHKICVCLLAVIFFIPSTAAAFQFIPSPAAFRTRKPSDKSKELTPEQKQNALKLLSAVASETRQLSLPENRVRVQTIVADLLWEHDEPAARAVFQETLTELQNIFGNLHPPEGEDVTSAERSKHYNKRYKLAELRKEYILTLTPRDSAAALAALNTLKTELLEEYDPLRSDELEVQIAAAIAKKDAGKAYAVAQEQIGKEGVTSELISSLKELHQKNPELAAKLGRDILAKIKTSKIRIPENTPPKEKGSTENTNAAAAKTEEIEFWRISQLISTLSGINRLAVRDKKKNHLPVLSEAEMRELVTQTANAYLTTTNPVPLSISSIMPEITHYAPALAQRIRHKLGAEASQQLDKTNEINAYYITRKEKSIEELLKEAERVKPEMRDSRYADVAYRALEEGEPEKAQAAAARITDKKTFRYVFEQIKIALPLAKAERGEIAEVRKMLGTMKTNQERITLLTELANSLAAKGDKETAKNLVDEAVQMMPPHIRKMPDLEAAARIALAYSFIAPELAFPIAENGVWRMNEYINAGFLLSDFFDHESVASDEWFFQAINQKALLNMPDAAELLNNLGRADLERTINLADKFERRDIRLYARLRIAQALLDSKAAEKDKQAAEQIEHGEEEMN